MRKKSMVLLLVVLFGITAGFFVKSEQAFGSTGQNNATIVSHTIPAKMKPNTSYQVSITVKNTGSSTWTEENLYRLGAVGDSDPFGSGRVMIANASEVQPRETYEFTFTMISPATPGTYTTDWRMVQDGVEWFGSSLVLQVEVTNNLKVNDATIVSHNIPDTMKSWDTTYHVTIAVRNDGLSTWTEGNQFRLGAVGNSDLFGPTRIYIANNHEVKPGEIYEFTFTMKSPRKEDKFSLGWQMVQEGVGWFGTQLRRYIDVRLNTSEINQATIVSHTIPKIMKPNTSYQVSITVKNTGLTTWTEGKLYRLGAVNDSDPFGPGRILISNNSEVRPGETYEFTFTMTSPATPGTYLTDWRMVKEYSEWFGQYLKLYVEVTDNIPYHDATIVSHTIPAKMKPNTSYQVSVSVRNDGRLSWIENSQYSLGSVSFQDSFGFASVNLNNDSPVNFGETYDFTFTLKSPSKPGVYTICWRMREKDEGWFGSYLILQIHVTSNLASNAATIISHDIPDQMASGIAYPVTITVRNDGMNSWTPETYRLAAVGGSDPFAEPIQAFAPNQVTETGQTYTFAFMMKAPNVPDRYNTSWRMEQIHDGQFGNTLTKEVSVMTAVRQATIMGSNIPQTMEAGEVYPVWITIRNDGNFPWTAENEIRLATTGGNSFDPMFKDIRVGLNENAIVYPGQEYTFHVTLNAPLKSGTYTSNWRMEQGGFGYFGTMLSKTIYVVSSLGNVKYKYDQSGRLAYVQNQNGYRYDLLYDDNGNLVQREYIVDLLDNPGFEFDYSSGWVLRLNMTLSNEFSKTGNRSIKYDSSSPLTGESFFVLSAQPNTMYNLSGWVHDSDLTSGTIYIDWLEQDNRGYVVVDGWLSTRTTPDSPWKYQSSTFTTSPATTNLIIRVVVENATGKAYADDIQLIRLIQNPDFEHGASGWTLSPQMSISSNQSYSGNSSLRFYSGNGVFDAAAVSKEIYVTPNTTYKLTAALLDQLASGNFRIECLEYDLQNNLIATSGSLEPTIQNQWQVSSISFTTKPRTQKLFIRVVADSMPQGEAFVDQLMLERF